MTKPNKKRIKELDIVTLKQQKGNVKKGSRGTVVLVYSNGKAYEVEFVSDSGYTDALMTVTNDEIVKVWNYEK